MGTRDANRDDPGRWLGDLEDAGVVWIFPQNYPLLTSCPLDLSIARSLGLTFGSTQVLAVRAMILYQLKCTQDHQFEAWFKDAATYDAQSAVWARFPVPYCGSHTGFRRHRWPRVWPRGPRKPESVEARAKEVAEQIFQTAEKLRQHVEENCDNVGEQVRRRGP